MTNRQKHGHVPKHKVAKKSKTKPKPKSNKSLKKSTQNKPKTRQTRLTLQPLQTPAPQPCHPPRRGGRRIEEVPKSKTGNLGAVVTSPNNFRKDIYNASPVQFHDLSTFISFHFNGVGPIRTLPPNEALEQDTEATRQMNAIKSSSPPSPTPVRSGKKRKYQSRIDDLFLPNTDSNGRKIIIFDSDSDSDILDNIQLEPEQPADSPKNGSASDADSDVIGPRARRQRHLPSSPVANHPPRTPSPSVQSDEELREEVRDLTSSAKKSIIAQRTRDAKTRNKRKSRFQRNLESLRKKKQGLQSDSDEESEKGKALYDSNSDIDSIASDDFIVEDKQELTLEEMMEIPPEFTSVSYQGPQLNFKVVIQAEVFALLHPDYHALDYSGIPHLEEGLHEMLLTLFIRILDKLSKAWSDKYLGLPIRLFLATHGSHGSSEH